MAISAVLTGVLAYVPHQADYQNTYLCDGTEKSRCASVVTREGYGWPLPVVSKCGSAEGDCPLYIRNNSNLAINFLAVLAGMTAIVGLARIVFSKRKRYSSVVSKSRLKEGIK